MDFNVNTTQTSTEEGYSMPAPFSSQTMFIYELSLHLVITGAFAGFGVVSNIINIIVFRRQGILSNSSTVHLTGLAISDGLSCVLFIVRIVGLYFEHFSDSASKPSTASSIALFFADYVGTCIQMTCWITAFTAFERVVSILFPFSVKKMFTPKRSLIVVLAIFLGTIVVDCPSLLYFYMAWNIDPKTNKSYIELYKNNQISEELYRLYLLISPTIIRFMTIFVVIVCNIILFWRVNSSHKFRNTTRIAKNSTRTNEQSVDISAINKNTGVKKINKMHLSQSSEVTKSVNMKASEKKDVNITLSTKSPVTSIENIEDDLKTKHIVIFHSHLTKSPTKPNTAREMRENLLHEVAPMSNSDITDPSVLAKIENIKVIENTMDKDKVVSSTSYKLKPLTEQNSEITIDVTERDQAVCSLNKREFENKHQNINNTNLKNSVERNEITVDSDTPNSAFKPETLSKIHTKNDKNLTSNSDIAEPFDKTEVESNKNNINGKAKSKQEFSEESSNVPKSVTAKTKIMKTKEMKLLRMIIAMSVLFLACYIPCVPYSVIFYVLEEGRDFHFYHKYVCWILIIFIQTINSSSNIFIYYRLSSRYKEEFDKLFGLNRKRLM